MNATKLLMPCVPKYGSPSHIAGCLRASRREACSLDDVRTPTNVVATGLEKIRHLHLIGASSMRVVIALKALCLTGLLCSSLAVPVARVMGCGKEDPDLKPERKKYCCEHFGMDCEQDSTEPQPVFIQPEGKDTPSLEATPKRPSIYERLVRKRQIGSPCREPYFSCGAGLECHMGVCRRVQTHEHLESLIERGKAVEKEQNMDFEDSESSSPRRNNKDDHPMLRGQSITLEDGENGGLRRRPQVAGKRDGPSFFFEEDEVAANLADLLESRLHMVLNSSQVHSIRELISGTLDERAQREEEEAHPEPLHKSATDQSLATNTEEHLRNGSCSVPPIAI